jgi:osmotically-inducible protein OsmY
MNRYSLLYSVLIASVSTGMNTGCALYHAYAKCGLSGGPEDAKVSRDVTRELGRDSTLQPPNMIHVQTCDHVVYLTGQVNTELVRNLAQTTAAHVAGVSRVENSISLCDAGG